MVEKNVESNNKNIDNGFSILNDFLSLLQEKTLEIPNVDKTIKKLDLLEKDNKITLQKIKDLEISRDSALRLLKKDSSLE